MKFFNESVRKIYNAATSVLVLFLHIIFWGYLLESTERPIFLKLVFLALVLWTFLRRHMNIIWKVICTHVDKILFVD